LTDRPILFSGAMVKALLAGRKTQTRRVLTPQPNVLNGGLPMNNGRGSYSTDDGWKRCRFAVDDRLYVREAWRVSRQWDSNAPRDLPPQTMTVFLEAGGSIANQDAVGDWRPVDWPGTEIPEWAGKFRQGMHMPRWASRLTLTVSDVRVQRLQEITEADAIAEGIECEADPSGMFEGMWKNYGPDDDEGGSFAWYGAIASYRSLWNKLNAERGFGFDTNPWIVAVSFGVQQGNIDQVQG
jgi:hypothetical protein